MKQFLLSVCVWMLVAAGAAAQETILVYRNDGGTEYLFAKADIDSIVCSCVDMDSVEHADWQTQVIYTSDSVYRIPLAAIDSVCLGAKPAVIGEAIDLGLRVKWASHNVGASSPEECGGYYAWGETEEKTGYSWDTYAHYSSGIGPVHIGDNICGTAYDVARVKWGGLWRMPTLDEIKELREKCSWKKSSYKGVKGMLVTGPNGNSIFLPAAGDRWDENLSNDGSKGYYWSGTLDSLNESDAYLLFFGMVGAASGSRWLDMYRHYGFTVRPVATAIRVETGSALNVTETSAVVSGYADGLESAEMLCELGVVYGTTPDVEFGTGQYVSSGKKASGDFTVQLTGLKDSTLYYYRTCLALDGEYYYGKTRSFKNKVYVIGEAIDLGLSVKWASHNMGASSPEEYGGYYAWGETEEKEVYNEDTYAYYQSGTGHVHIGDSISGTAYDVARVKWGGLWRMPTWNEIKELFEKCNWEWTTYKGVNGQLVTGPNGNSIFLPAAGGRGNEDLGNDGSIGFYWSGTRFSDYEFYAGILNFDSGNCYGASVNRGYGFTVRPVAE